MLLQNHLQIFCFSKACWALLVKKSPTVTADVHSELVLSFTTPMVVQFMFTALPISGLAVCLQLVSLLYSLV